MPNFNSVPTSSVSNAQITSTGNTALITKGYADATYTGGGGGGSASIGQYSSTDITTNINTSTPTIIPFNTTDSITDTNNYSLSLGAVTVSDAGTYLISAMISYSSTVQRANPTTQVFINGVATDYVGYSGYLRSNSGHNEASNYVQAYFDLLANDEITIRSAQAAQSGVVNLISGDSVLSISKVVASGGGGGSGTITGITAGTGISGGGTSGSVTVNIDNADLVTDATNSTTLDLSNPHGSYYTDSANSGQTYTTTNATQGGYAYVRVLTASSGSNFPSVTGATLLPGAAHATSTEFQMVVYSDGGSIYYYFLEI